MEMRLGKTIVARRWAVTRPRAKRILVACPIEIIRSWRKELALEGEELVELRGPDRVERMWEARRGGARWFAVNFENLRVGGHRTKGGKPIAVPSEIALADWDVVIIDESTAIRSPRSQITKVALGWLSRARYKAILTGLPNPEGADDYVTQFCFLFGEFMGCRNYWDWRARNMIPLPTRDWAPRRGVIGRVREEVHRRAFVLSRKDAGIGNRKMREPRYVQLPAAIRREMRSAEKDFEAGDLMTNNKLVTLMWMQRLAGGRFPDDRLWHDAKMRELVKLATGELRGQPIVVWARYTDEIDAACKALESAGIRALRVKGKLFGRKHNADHIDRFMAGDADALVCQPQCVAKGVDLSRASIAIYLSNYFDYEVRAQSEDRIEHPLKREPLLILDILAEDTIDEDILEALKDKRFDSGLILRRFLERRSEPCQA